MATVMGTDCANDLSPAMDSALSPYDLLRNLQGDDVSDNGLAKAWSAAIAYWRGEALDSTRRTAAALLALRNSMSWGVASECAAVAWVRIDADFEAGLLRRLGQHIEPLGDLEPVPADDIFHGVLGLATEPMRAEVWAFKMVRELRDWVWSLKAVEVENDVLRPASTPPSPENIAICNRCTLIFRPARKRRAKRCPACSKLKLAGSACFVVEPAKEWPRGVSVPLRIAEIGSGGFEAWRGRHVLRCVECGDHFVRIHQRAAVCGDACEQKRLRRRQPSGG